MKRAGTLSFTSGAAVAALALALAGACKGRLTFEPGGDDDDDSSGRADAGAHVPGADAAPGAPDAAPGAPPDASPDYMTLSPQEQQLFDTINEERGARGLVLVELRADLNCAANRHSADIGATQTCTHTGSDGSSPGDRVSDCGGPGWSGEIVACGQDTPRAAVDAWISSPGHNAIMFDPGQRYVGVGMSNNFWTATFDQ